jgi:hypothetical protein
MLLHVNLYECNKIILMLLSQKGNAVADHRAFYPVTGKGHRYCGKVFTPRPLQGAGMKNN